MLKRSAESGHLCLAPVREGIHFSLSDVIVIVRFWLYPFSDSECYLLFIFCWEFLPCLNIRFVKLFLASINMIIGFSCLECWRDGVHWFDFQILNQPSIPGINTTLSWYIVFLYSWILFANILLSIYVTVLIKHIYLVFVLFHFIKH